MKGASVFGVVVLLAAPIVWGAGTVEFPVWSKDFQGQVAGKDVRISLERRGSFISGRYCYAPCRTHTRYALSLKGTIDGDDIELEEHDVSRAEMPLTGFWRLRQGQNGLVLDGNWNSADRLQHAEVALKEVKPENDPGLEIHLVADSLPEREASSGCLDIPLVSAIKLYKDGHLLQTLATESQGTCEIYLPDWQDVNFDGRPDLMLVQYLPAGPNIPYQTWLNDGQRFIDAPPGFQEITAPDIDEKYQNIVSFWRGSCCSHGVNVYRWKGDDVMLVEQGSSYMQPLWVKGKAYHCYIVPGYRNGHVSWPVQERNGKLTPLPWDEEICSELDSSEHLLTMIQSATDPGDVRMETLRWKKVVTSGGARWCPEVPFLDGDKITRRVLKQSEYVEALCQKQDPYKEES